MKKSAKNIFLFDAKKLRRGRLFWLFLIGVVVPCFVISIFGFRAIANERYAFEHRIREQYHLAASSIAEKIELSLTTLTNHVDTIIRDYSASDLVSHTMIESTYLLGGKGRILHPLRLTRRKELPPEVYSAPGSELDSFASTLKVATGRKDAVNIATRYLLGQKNKRHLHNSRVVIAGMLLYDKAVSLNDTLFMFDALNFIYGAIISDTPQVYYEEALYYGSFILTIFQSLGTKKLYDSIATILHSKLVEISMIHDLEDFSNRGRIPDGGFFYGNGSLFYVKALESGGKIVNKISISSLMEMVRSYGWIPENAGIIIAGPDGLVLASQNIDSLSTEKMGVRTQFAPSLPMLSLGLIEAKPDAIRELLKKYRLFYNVFFLLLVLSVGVGAFSLYLSARKESEAADERSGFIAAVSHELKTPLTSIHMLAEMLKSGKVTDDKKRQEYYEIINRESERLQRLINTILDFSKVDDMPSLIDAAPFNLDAIVDEALTGMAPLLDMKDADVDRERCQTPAVVKGDRRLMLQVVINLIDNSVKYSEGRPYIGIRVHKEGNSVVFTLRDKGCGIADGEENRIFDEFYRGLGWRSGAVSGTGLGLAIVSRIVRQHGGKISASNADGGGLLVVIHLPTEEIEKQGKLVEAIV